MLPDRVSNPGPLTYESGALPIALRGPARTKRNIFFNLVDLLNTLYYEANDNRINRDKNDRSKFKQKL